MRNQAHLIAYVNRLSGGGFRELQQLLDGPLQGVFGGVHLLPFFDPIDGADAGFDPIDHLQVDHRLGTWDDVAALAERTEVMADVIVNHVSIRSRQFQDYDLRGLDSPYAGMFLTCGHVFPDGAREADLLAIRTPRPALPFTRHRTAHGDEVLLWTTFTPDQIDIDVAHPEAQRYFADILARFQAAGISAIRLDAVPHVIKKAGTSCFMIPETFAFIAGFAAQARTRHLEVLVEVHGHYQDQVEVARHVDWVYDFALPPLVLHTLYTRDARPLKRWLEVRPHNVVTVLDTHDGIGVQDVGADPGRGRFHSLLSADAIAALIETIHCRSRDESRQASGNAASNVDSSHINCTFYDALGRDDTEYLVARAIQCFVPGVPQIYYVGLLAGGNDVDLLRRTGVGRDINRHFYSAAELQEALARPVVQSLLGLLRFRNSHPAFGGTFQIVPSASDRIVLEWRTGADFARLDVDLSRTSVSMTCSPAVAGHGDALAWQSVVGS